MRIIIADDPTITREGLALILARDPDIKTVGEARDKEALLCLVDATGADVILLDLGLPGLDGLDVLKRIQAKRPEANVVIITTHDDAASIRRAIEHGVSGYLLESVDPVELLHALRRVEAGHCYIQGDLTGALLEAMVNRPPRTAEH